MVTNIKINFSKEDYPWLDNFKSQKEAEEHIKNLIDVGKIVYNLTKYSINFDNDIFLPIKNEMNKISIDNHNKTQLINQDIINSMNDMKQSISKIVGGANNASLKGKIGENIIEEIIHGNFPEDVLLNTSKKARESDYHFITNNETILLEIKTYSETVGSSQIEKFKKDMIRCGHKLGIFYSSTSGIVGIKNRIHLQKINNNQAILFVPNGGIEYANIVYCISFCKILLQNNFNQCIIDVNLLKNYFEDFHNTYADISKISFEINKSKKSIENIMEDLYRQSIDLELKSKYLIEDSYKKLEKIIVKTDKKSSNINPLISDFIEILRINNDQRLINLINLIKLLEKYNFYLDCINGSTDMDKLLIKKNEKDIADVKICKTKINIIFKEPHINIALEKESFKYIEMLLKEN